MDDLSLLDDLDRRLDPLVPDTPLPADLLARGRTARRRRSLAVGAAATAVVVLVAGLGIAVAHRSTRTPADVASDPTPATSVDDIPAGFRLVGFHGVALAVPGRWVLRGGPCGLRTSDPESLTLGRPSARGTCSRPGFVTISPDEDGTGYLAGSEVSVNGLDATRSDTCPSTYFCRYSSFVSIGLPDLGVTVFVAGGSSSVQERIVTSIREMPTGRTAVPPLQPGTDRHVAEDRLLAAGLVPGSPYTHLTSKGLVATRPAAGSLVPFGSTVVVR
ncbi:hypothetical protein FE634_02050 [Nocardioides dongxiaopingii]|uniref:hypothetical protein n=1 Tax=Nocardioides sp. S-1144 TaxID=2582905 RepID=UPI00110DF524|nr:hypothetical protein [Nocardioides sp. S-1144]QCW49499.1 hypothetical protein FE634_02050 [Nocardioides sp. S-1144]